MLIERIVKMSTNPGQVVLDIFSGSGTACKVAEQLGRKWIGIEKERKYCEISEHRLKNMEAKREQSCSNP